MHDFFLFFFYSVIQYFRGISLKKRTSIQFVSRAQESPSVDSEGGGNNILFIRSTDLIAHCVEKIKEFLLTIKC